MDIELIETETKPSIRKRSILTGIQKTRPDYKLLLNTFMKLDRETFYKNQQLLIDLLVETIETAFTEGQRAGTVRTEYIGGDNGIKAEDVYKKRSDNYVGD